MPAHKSHDFPYIQPERHDELSTGVPDVLQVEASQERRPDGKLAKGASTVPSLGGKAQKGTTSLSHRIDGAGLKEPYRRKARTHRRAVCSELARTVGGGVCGVLTSTLVKLGSEALALAEQALDEGNIDLHRKLGETARMHFMYARENAAKEAQSRPPGDPREALNRRILGLAK